MIWENTSKIFLAMLPYAILFSFALLIYERYLSNKNLDINFLFFCFFTYVFTYVIEVLGVTTGFPFGRYQYLDSLGLKFLEVPIIIGLNWMMLIYMTGSITSVYLDRYFKNVFVRIFLSSILMVFYDFFLEQVSCQMRMWCWYDGSVGPVNYVSWFFISLFLHYTSYKFSVNYNSKISVYMYLGQIAMFIILFMFNKHL